MAVGSVYDDVRDGFLRILGDGALGLYVRSEESAFLAVTRSRLDGSAEEAVREFHRGLAASPLQGSYAPSADLSSPMSLGRAWLHLSPGSGELLPANTDNTAQHRWLMRHASRTTWGPPPESLIHDIDVHGLRAEAIGLARSKAEEIEDHPGLLDDASARSRLVSDLCSVLHTAVVGTVLVGPPAVHWATDEVPERERGVLAAVRDGVAPEPAQTRAFAWEIHRLAGAAALRFRED